MALRLDHAWMRSLPELRWQPVVKRVTVRLGDQLVAVTDRPVLVFEPKRVVASYAVPLADLRGRARAGDRPARRRTTARSASARAARRCSTRACRSRSTARTGSRS